ncbi:hypothetical protein R4036_004592 [Salmonella enterica]|nr:hypothetical protein [Salmonella enterica]
MKNEFNVSGFVTSAVAMYKSGTMSDAEKFKAFFEQVSPFFVGAGYTTNLEKVVKESAKNEHVKDDLSGFQSSLIAAIGIYMNSGIKFNSEFNPKNHISHKLMKTEDFISIADYPANRDVTKRMKKEHMKALSNYEQTRVVIVEITEENKMYWDAVKSEPMKGIKLMKLDGHSRAYAWTHKQLEAPEMLDVTVYKGLNDEQINRCYDALTSPLTAATVAEQTFTLKKRVNFEPVTKFVNSNWKTAFLNNKLKFDEYEYLKFVDYLKILDGWLQADYVDGKERKQPKGMNSAGIKSAIIAQIKRDGDISEFWNLALTGDLEERSMTLEVSNLIDKAAVSGNGGKAAIELMEDATDCLNLWEQKQKEESAA